ncbi:MAG: radical SAM family heme chaperone HemW [Pseudomonadota bacterium]
MTAALAGPGYGFGLYVHWPYCARICPYCDFNVYAAKDRDTGPLVAAMLRDLEAHAERLGDHPPLDSVFLGGGTPSLMAPAEIDALLGAADRLFGLSSAEITIEANPNDATIERLQAWREAGVTRLSLGVQSFDDDALKFLGRDHTGADARRALGEALSAFASVSADFIYARPDQTAGQWAAELADILAAGAQHLSLYELTIEPATAFGRAAARGTLTPAGEDAQADLYELTQAALAAAGFDAYEISNHAAAPEHRSRHNLTYWRSGDWIGIGPGAHGRLTIDSARLATEAERRPADYVRRIEEDGVGWAAAGPLAADDIAREVLAMGLRPADGVQIDRLKCLDKGMAADLQAQGLIEMAGGRLRLTSAGRLLADQIAAKLAP